MTSKAIELPDQVGVVNVGLPLFADAVAEQGRPSVQVDWRIPTGGDLRAVAVLRRLSGPRTERVDEANNEVVRRLDKGVPRLVGVQSAGEVLSQLSSDRVLLHPGPPIELDQVCDPLRRSMRVTVLAEGWCQTIDEADALLESGDVSLLPANDLRVVAPMASVVGPSTPMWVVALDADGQRITAFAPIGQGSGDVAWFGRETPAALDRLFCCATRLLRCCRASWPTADPSTCSRSPRRQSPWVTTYTCERRRPPTFCCATCCHH